MEQRPSGVFLSPRNNCSQGSIWNLNCGEMVFVINNQIFEPLKYLCPLCICTLCPQLENTAQGIVLMMMNWKVGNTLGKHHTREKAGGENKSHSSKITDLYESVNISKQIHWQGEYLCFFLLRPASCCTHTVLSKKRCTEKVKRTGEFFKGKRIRKIKIGREVVRWDKWRERRASCHLWEAASLLNVH